MKELKIKRLLLLKSIAIWSLFSIAILRGLTVFGINPSLLYLFIPGFLIFGFLIYFRLKTKVFLTFQEFLVTAFTISCIFLLFHLLVDTFIRISPVENQLSGGLISFVAGILISSALYWVSYLFKRKKS